MAVPHQQNSLILLGIFLAMVISKAEKRKVKRSTFRSRVEKSSFKKKIQKRRRPSKKLAANLASLVDALPDKEEEGQDKEPESKAMKLGFNSIASKPGAMKKRLKLEELEKDRFEKNMTQMAKPDSSLPGLPTLHMNLRLITEKFSRSMGCPQRVHCCKHKLDPGYWSLILGMVEREAGIN